MREDADSVSIPERGESASGVSRFLPPALLGAALAVTLLLALPAVEGDSETFDEGIHLSSGYTFLTERDYRLSTDNPPVAKVLAALPLLFMDVRSPVGTRSWAEARRHVLDYEFLYGSGNDPDRMLRAARKANLFWHLLLVGAVYGLALELFGRGRAWIALAAAAFCPTVLGLSHLVTVDAAGTALFFLSTVAFWRFLRAPSALRACAAGVLLGGCLGTKHSSLVLLPSFAVMAAWAAWEARRRGIRPTWLRGSVWGTALALSAFLTIWGVFGFRFAGTVDPACPLPWATLENERGLLAWGIDRSRDLHLLPDAYLFGLKFVGQWTAEGHPAYALGAHSESGWWWYFPLAIVLKTPLPTLALAVWGIASLYRRRREDAVLGRVLAVPPAVFLFMAMAQSVNIGVRHVLPLYPFLFVAASGIGGGTPVLRRLAPLLLTAAGALGCIVEAPHTLSQFSAPWGWLVPRHELLADSNLDWGQDLGRLKAYMDSRAIPEVKLAYFGAASPRHLGLRHQVLPGAASYVAREPEWPKAGNLAPGDVVAVSASVYVGLFQKDRDYYRRTLGQLRPEAIIGGSILVFRIPP